VCFKFRHNQFPVSFKFRFGVLLLVFPTRLHTTEVQLLRGSPERLTKGSSSHARSPKSLMKTSERQP
jgi:hypothetical protein